MKKIKSVIRISAVVILIVLTVWVCGMLLSHKVVFAGYRITCDGKLCTGEVQCEEQEWCVDYLKQKDTKIGELCNTDLVVSEMETDGIHFFLPFECETNKYYGVRGKVQ